MKKQIILGVMIFALIVAVFTAFVSESEAIGTLKQAKDFMANGQYQQAEAIFQARTEKNNQDADSYYWWGICQVQQGYQADQKFLQAIGLKPDFNKLIAGIYQQEANVFLRKGQIDTATSLFDKAIKWDEGSKIEIAKSLFDSGQYKLAIRYHSGYADKTADIFFAKGEILDGEAALSYYRETGKYSSKHNETIKSKLLAISKIKFEEKDIQFWRSAAAEFGSIPPDFKVYKLGTYTFKLKAGQKTDHWVTFPQGVIINYSFSSEDGKFQVLYDDGEVVSIWSAKRLPKNKYKFKMIAVIDQPKITMVVTSKSRLALSQN